MFRYLISAILLLSTSLAFADEEFSSLEERMSGKEYREAGLEKLTDEELANLNRWIREHGAVAPAATSATPAAPATVAQPVAASTAPAAADDERGFEIKRLQDSSREPITSRIVGSFNGWSGNTVFRLENGMIWEQSDNETFYVRTMEGPEVTISPGAFKTWRLQVVGYGSTVKVKRIQ